jgi:hypothetical protein
MNSPYIKTLRVIHLALFTGCLLFLIVGYFIKKESLFFDTSFSDPLSILGVVSLALIFVSSFIYMQRLKTMNENDSIDIKKQKYQAAYILLLALIEGPALFNIVIFLTTNNAIHLVIASIFILNLLSKMPNKIHISQVTNIPIDEL